MEHTPGSVDTLEPELPPAATAGPPPDAPARGREDPTANETVLVRQIRYFVAICSFAAGLLHVLVSVFFLVQLLTTLTAVRDRLAMLRSLAVLLGCAFFLRFIALESLYATGRGVIKRVMTALMEGITLGALDYVPTGSATGYVAFLTLTLYLVGLVLMPAGDDGVRNGTLISVGKPAEPDELYGDLPALRGE